MTPYAATFGTVLSDGSAQIGLVDEEDFKTIARAPSVDILVHRLVGAIETGVADPARIPAALRPSLAREIRRTTRYVGSADARALTAALVVLEAP